MQKLELLTVLRSIDLALEKGSKEDVQQLVKTLINDATGETKPEKAKQSNN